MRDISRTCTYLASSIVITGSGTCDGDSDGDSGGSDGDNDDGDGGDSDSDGSVIPCDSADVS